MATGNISNSYFRRKEKSLLNLFRPGFFRSSTKGGGGGIPPLRNSENNKTWRVDSTSENVSFDLRIMR